MEARERIKLHRMLKGVGFVVVLLLAGALYLGASTARYMKGIIRDQYNQQQLVLARATALMVEEGIQNAISDLSLLSTIPAIQYCDQDDYDVLLLSILPVLNRDNILEISRVDRDGASLAVVNDQGIGLRPSGQVYREPAVFQAWASDASNRGTVMGTKVRRKKPAKGKGFLVLDLVTPIYEDAANREHPHPSQRFAGYLHATLDVGVLLRRIFQPITSGKTGYAWVIDSSGSFLYHPEELVIGENAFTIRHKRNPDVSLARINEIQRKEMLEGKEGTGIYIAGWHREVVEPVEKIIAYTPVRIQGPSMPYAWSVAVVTPVHEIEGIVSSVYGKQILLQCVIVFIIFLSSLTVVLYELRWSTILEQEVAAKTADIQRYTRELERSEAKYRTLVESAEDFIFTLKPDGRIETANRHMATTLETDGSSPTGLSLHRMLPPEAADDQLEIVQEALRSGHSQKTEVLIRSHGADLWLDCRYIPIQSDHNGDDWILGIARDVTERKRMETQLIQAEKLASLGTLAAGVAHEMNNPLGVILGFSELLLEKAEPGTTEFEDLKTIERHGLHCKEIVDRLLSFATTGEDYGEGCDINQTVERALSMVQEDLTRKGIQLSCFLDENLPFVVGDSEALQQVLLNLLRNALHAMDGLAPGVLTVSTRLESSKARVEVDVSDTGPGIKKESIQRIFDPFFTTRDVGSGMGLGLSVSFGIVSRYGGTIRCESETEEDGADSPGTTVIVSLPTLSAVSELEASEGIERGQAQQSREHI